jgi:glycosyltransferase involved in cell wall biosynthesis
MKINVFLLCYNEEILIPHTIAHYKKYLPSCEITIYDNNSTDNSVEIAKKIGCNVISWFSNNKADEYAILHIKNNCWKNINEGWIIVCDMDEWIFINEDELSNEEKKGNTILKTQGLGIVGNSKKEDLSDIDIKNIKKCFMAHAYSKRICFNKKEIDEIGYGLGSHNCNPIGNIKYSESVYYIKHMKFLGLPFLIKRWYDRYERYKLLKQVGMGCSYTESKEELEKHYYFNVERATEMSPV